MEILVAAVIVAGFVYLWRTEGARRAAVDYGGAALSDVSEPEYRLLHFENEDGSGYVVERLADERRLNWRGLQDDHPSLYAFEVAGESHYLNQIQGSEFRPGALVRLMPEPSNRYDPNAVAVRSANGRGQCGYVPRNEAPSIKALVETGTPHMAMVMWAVKDEKGERCALRVLVVQRNAPLIPLHRDSYR